jgi:hypothetical protein
VNTESNKRMEPGPSEAPGDPPAIERGDRAILIALLLVLTLASTLTPIRNYDYWWHLATGRWILERHAWPRADPFSFASGGAPWVDHEWLFQIAVYLGQRVLGHASLVLLKAAGVLLLTLLAYRHLRNERHSTAGASLLLVPALLGSAFRLDVRPELATLLLVPIALFTTLRARSTGTAAPLVLVVLLAGLGANLHVGILILPAILALGGVTTLLRGERPGEPRFGRTLLVASAAAGLAAAVNPYGFRIYAVPFEIERILGSIPSPNLEWIRPAPGQFPLFYASAAALVALVVAGRREIDPIATPAGLLAAALAAAHVRNIGLFFLIFPFATARPARACLDRIARSAMAARLRPRLQGLGGRARVRPGFVTVVLLLAVAPPALHVLPPGIVWGMGVASDNEPSRAADFLAKETIGTRLFNDVRFGGYLIWRRFPEHQVFIDGRNEVYAPLLRELFAALKDSREWEAFLDRHQIDSAFVRYAPTLQRVVIPATAGKPARVMERAFAAAYFPRERWALVYWDDDAMVLVRRTPRYESVIHRLEYRSIHPDDWRDLTARVLSGGMSVDSILVELKRKLEEDPSCERARGLLAYFGSIAASRQRQRPGAASEGM